MFVVQNSFGQYKVWDIPYKSSEINMKDSKGKQGLWFFIDNGDSSVLEMKTFIDDTLNGYFERYWNNGQVSEQGYYKEGKLDSIVVGYWEDGKQRSFVNYKNGKLHGLTISYGDDGSMINRLFYVNGQLDTSYSNVYQDSIVYAESELKAKVKASLKLNNYDTLFYYYSSDWNERQAIYFKDTLFKVIEFFKGEVAIEGYYERGLEVERIVYYEELPGRIEKVFFYKNDSLIRIENYNKNGELVKEETPR